MTAVGRAAQVSQHQSQKFQVKDNLCWNLSGAIGLSEKSRRAASCGSSFSEWTPKHE